MTSNYQDLDVSQTEYKLKFDTINTTTDLGVYILSIYVCFFFQGNACFWCNSSRSIQFEEGKLSKQNKCSDKKKLVFWTPE